MATNNTATITATSNNAQATFKIPPLLICGPSGVGKGTLLTPLYSSFGSLFGKRVSHTTRQPRTGEINATHYYFTSKEQMKLQIDAGEFIETAEVHGNTYGTTYTSLHDVEQQGKICILEIDYQGALTIKKRIDAFTMFIAPPSIETLRERLTSRGSETQQTLDTRLKTAEKEMAFFNDNKSFFDYVVVNDNFEQAYILFKLYIMQLYPHLKQHNLVANLIKPNNNTITNNDPNTKFTIPPLIVCGPSGVGKGTILTRLYSVHDTLFGQRVSHTTRQPRNGEINGKHYNFTTREQMESEIKEGKFIENAIVHGNMYGTTYKSLHDVEQQGKICILEIDYQGALAIKSKVNVYTVFIAPPSIDALKHRLAARGSENEQTTKTRLETAAKEMAFFNDNKSFFDFVIVNDNFEQAYVLFNLYLTQLYPHLQQHNILQNLISKNNNNNNNNTNNNNNNNTNSNSNSASPPPQTAITATVSPPSSTIH